ncbi:MAG: hypothetical protein OHK0046_18680 [Anaerolineae bacterium]
MTLNRLWNRLRPTPQVDKAQTIDDLKLCFLIAASPNDGFFSQIAMFRMALNALGGIYHRAHMVIVFGDEVVEPLPEVWKPYFDNISTYWVDPAAFEQDSYLAQGDARWLYLDAAYDFVIFTDADVMLVRPIDDLLADLLHTPAVGGTVAHFTFPQFPGEHPQQKWTSLAQELLGKPLPFTYTHTLTTDEMESGLRQTPFYVNYGFVILPYVLAEHIKESVLRLRPLVSKRLYLPYFSAQVGLTLAIYAHDLPCKALPLKYNFPNDRTAEAMYPADMQDIRVLHYLRTERFNRQEIFAAPDAFEHFLALELQGSEAIFQAHVRQLTGGHYPFSR